MKRIRVGLSGYGGIAKAHSLACVAMGIVFDQLPFEVSLDTVCRRSAEGGRKAFRNIVTSFDELASNRNIDVISICTPNDLHFQQGEEALLAGKSVYCEKPLGLNYREARELAELSRKTGTINQVALIYRFMPAVVTARDYIAQGKLGEIINFKFVFRHKGYLDGNRPVTWRMIGDRSGGGAVLDLGIHMADTMRFMLGEVESVQAHLDTYFKRRYGDESRTYGVDVDTDEYALLNIVLKNGPRGMIECSRVASVLQEDASIEIYGTKGSISISSLNPNYPEIHDQDKGITISGMKPGESDFGRYLRDVYPSAGVSLGTFQNMHTACLCNMFRNIAEGRVLHSETPTFDEAAASQKIIEMALVSNREGNRIVYSSEIQ